MQITSCKIVPIHPLLASFIFHLLWASMMTATSSINRSWSNSVQAFSIIYSFSWSFFRFHLYYLTCWIPTISFDEWRCIPSSLEWIMLKSTNKIANTDTSASPFPNLNQLHLFIHIAHSACPYLFNKHTIQLSS